MCLADLYDFSPEQRAAAVRLESLRAMHSYVQGVRLAIRDSLSTPAAATDLPPSLTPGHAAAGHSLDQTA